MAAHWSQLGSSVPADRPPLELSSGSGLGNIGRAGWKQKLLAWEARVPDSQLVKLLTSWRSWGILSAHAAQQISAAAEHDGLNHPQVKLLAGIGSRGEHEQNCDRDMDRLVADSVLEKECLQPLKIAVKTGPNTWVDEDQQILEPHRLFSTLYHKFPKEFNERMVGGPRTRIPEFWEAMADNPAYISHPMRGIANHLEKAIPISLHGDGIPVTGIGRIWGKSAEIYSMGSVIGRGSTQFANFMIFFMFKQLMVANAIRNTSDTFFRRLCWSLYWLYRGKWPTHYIDDDGNLQQYGRYTIDGQRAGTFLAEEFFGAMFLLKGDLEQFANTLKLEHFGSNDPCFCCRANCLNVGAEARPWSDFSRGAAALLTIWTQLAWLAAHPDRHRLLRLPGVGVCNVAPDTMHCKHNGTDQYFFASTLKLLTHHILPHRPDANLQIVWGRIKANYGASSSQLSDITMSMYDQGDESFPVLKAQAAHIRHLGPSLLKTFVEFMDVRKQEHRWVRQALEASVRMEQILDEAVDAFRLPPLLAVEFLDKAHDFLIKLNAIRAHFGVRLQLFHVTIKSHMLLHIAINARYLNPRLAWCYTGEDMMKIIKKVIGNAQKGTPPRLVVAKVMRRYCKGMGLILSDSCLARTSL